MIRNDLVAVGALSEQLGYPVEMQQLMARFEHISSLGHHALLVTGDHEVSGWIHLEAVSDLIEETKVEIKALVVDENMRSKGVGTVLVQAAKEWAKTYGSNTIYLSCNIIRDRAHAFYEREGFTKVKTSHFFELKI
jgi:GNAT superfamily N-acetyltransferase